MCNGLEIGKVKPGKKPFSYNGKIPNRSVFAIGDNIESYDSRYFGFIDVGAIDAFLYPIF
jgi:type IV secretory pathway protease TraF